MFNIEEKNQELQILALAIEQEFKVQFPNGHFYSRVQNSMGISPMLSISLGLIEDVKDCANSIRMNDPMHHTFVIYTEKNGDFESSNGIGCLMTKPAKDSYLAMQSVKTKYRKTTGNYKKILRSFTLLFNRLEMLVDEHRTNIYNVENIDLKYLEVE